MNRLQRLSRVVVLIFISSVLLISFQNCADQVQFTHSIEQRSLDLKIDSQTSERKIKILFVIDPSLSMTDDITKMNNALNSLLDGMKELPVQLKFVSMTSVGSIANGADGSYTPNTVTEKYSVPSSVGISYVDPTTKKQKTDKIIEFNPSDSWNFRQLKVAAIQASVNQFVKTSQASENGGDVQERPVCAIVSELSNPLSFFQQGDAGAIILISDEDQYISNPQMSSTLFNVCSLYTKQTNGNRTTSTTAGDSHPQVRKILYAVRFEYDVFGDGGVFLKRNDSVEYFDKNTHTDNKCQNSFLTNFENQLNANSSSTYKNYRITGCTEEVASPGHWLNTEQWDIFYKKGLVNRSYFDPNAVYPPSNMTEVAWKAQDKCTRLSIYQTTDRVPRTLVQLYEYLGYSLSGACTLSYTGGTTTDIEKTFVHLDAHQFLSQKLGILDQQNKLRSEQKIPMNQLLKIYVEQNYGLNNIVLFGIYNTKPVASAANGAQGVIINQHISALMGESSSIDSQTFVEPMNRVKELIYSRIVGSSLYVPYNSKHEYLKALKVRSSTQGTQELVEGTDYQMFGQTVSFLNYKPHYDDIFEAVIESTPLE